MPAGGGVPVRFVWEPELAEAVARLLVDQRARAGEAAWVEAYHRRAEAVYALPAARREAGFAALHARVLREAGLDRRLHTVAARHPQVAAHLRMLRLCRALRADREGADLRPDTGGAVLRMRSERCADLEGFERFVDHEMVHLSDLLDPTFGHDPQALERLDPLWRRRVQERYRLAWAVTVDGRLVRAGRRPLASREEHRRRLAQGFGLSLAEVEPWLAALWAEPRPTHAALWALAVRHAAAPGAPGAPCPLCGFPTYAWVRAVEAALAAAVRQEAPEWEPTEGMCERCHERLVLSAVRGG
jgi:hypothetical protein